MKRSRSCNFSEQEKYLLLEIVSQYIEIVENKKADSKSIDEKKRVWKAIEVAFNNKSHSPRTWIILKTKWDNLKTDARRHLRNETLTSSGVQNDLPKLPREKALLEKIRGLIGERVDVIYLPFENNIDTKNNLEPALEPLTAREAESSLSGVSHQATEPADVKSFDEVLVREMQSAETENSEESQDWTSWNPPQLRTTLSNTRRFSQLQPSLTCQPSAPNSTRESLQKSITESLDIPKKSCRWRTRRRLQKTSPYENHLNRERLKLIRQTVKDAEEETAMRRELFKEMLKQEKIRTRILLLQMRKLNSDKL